MNLSTSQIKCIKDRINEDQLTIETLRDDLVDHLCCAVEAGMASGKSFDQSLDIAMSELAPDGFKKIETQTVHLLNSKHINMKKLAYSFGLVSSIAVCIGLLLKYLHQPFSLELTFLGFTGFVLIFIPSTLVDYFKLKGLHSISDKARIIFGYASLAAIVLGTLLKVFHLEGANLSVLVGVICFSFGFLPFVFLNLYKRSISQS